MSEFTLRSDGVDVEQIMRTIRARIREKRSADYTQADIQRLATVKLERFLEPGSVRSDLLEQYRRGDRGPAAPPPPPSVRADSGPTTRASIPIPPPPINYSFEANTLFDSSHVIVRVIRRLLGPLLKLFFNPGPLIHVLHLQADLNSQVYNQITQVYERMSQLAEMNHREQLARLQELADQIFEQHTLTLHDRIQKQRELQPLYFEIMHNLVVELTKLGIQTKNLRALVDSLAGRLDFDERRAHALEGLVQYRPDVTAPASSGPGAAPGPEASGVEQRRRRRRRRRRRGSAQGLPQPGAGPAPSADASARAEDEPPAPTDAAARDSEADEDDGDQEP